MVGVPEEETCAKASALLAAIARDHHVAEGLEGGQRAGVVQRGGMHELRGEECTCGSLVAKWKCEVGAHLGLSCALRCLCACLLCVLHAR